MTIEELIKDLTAIAAEYPGLPVKFRQGNQQLVSIDEAYFDADSFEQRIELA